MKFYIVNFIRHAFWKSQALGYSASVEDAGLFDFDFAIRRADAHQLRGDEYLVSSMSDTPVIVCHPARARDAAKHLITLMPDNAKRFSTKKPVE